MSESLPSVSAIIVAAGSGSRFGGPRPKQLAVLAGRPVLSHALAAFQRSEIITEIILVLPGDWLSVIEAEAVRPYGFTKVRCVAGGTSRTESTRRGFAAAAGEIILIHDGVRPLVRSELVGAVALAAHVHGTALAAVPERDTLKQVEDGLAYGTVDRAGLWRAQTPQGFRREIFQTVLNSADSAEATDDVALAERLGYKARVVLGRPDNLKITTPEDLEMAESLLALPSLRIGQGYDLHRLVPGRPLFLAGVEVPYHLGLLGHSDADVMAHALADALLGAAGLGDIGQHFPDCEAAWAGASGSLLLSETMKKVRAAGFELINADLTLIGEKPKIAPCRQAMAEAVSRALHVSASQINIKATTTEGQDAVGQGLALAATAVVLVLAAQATPL